MTTPVRVPADVDREDQILAGLTARQLAILTVAGLILYAGWSATRQFVPLVAYAVVAIPAGATATAIALGRRDGIGLDRLLLAAIGQRLAPRRQVSAPEGVHPPPPWLTDRATTVDGQSATYTPPAPMRLPARDVADPGVVDLGPDGLAAIAACGTVNFALRTPGEQEALVAAFGRYLHSLTAPVQVLVRVEHLDLSNRITDLRHRAPALPHPALETAALAHADYLTRLGEQSDLLRRQVLLVLREPISTTGPVDGLGGVSPLAALTARRRAATLGARWDGAARRAAEARLARRLTEAAELLGPAGLSVTPLDASAATAVLAAACNPGSLVPSPTGVAGASDIITLAPDRDGDQRGEPGTLADELLSGGT